MADNMRRGRRSHPPAFPAFNEPDEDAKLTHHPTFRDPDDEPEEPDIPETGETKPAEALVNDLESRLFKGRKVMVFGQITDKLARDVVARLLALVDESAKPIQIYVNSPGGHVESGDSIHDIIKFVRSSVPIYMIGTGWWPLPARSSMRPARRGSAFACRTRASCCISRWAACKAQQRTSTSRRARSSICASD